MVIGNSFFDIAVGEVTYFQVKRFYYSLVSEGVGSATDSSFRELLLGFNSYTTVIGDVESFSVRNRGSYRN
jgi:hypothetical protein